MKGMYPQLLFKLSLCFAIAFNKITKYIIYKTKTQRLKRNNDLYIFFQRLLLNLYE